MSVDGNWSMVLATPMGEQEATLTLATMDGKLTGTQSAQGRSAEITDGAVKGDELKWTASITDPMPLTLTFTGTVDGDTMSGHVAIGPIWRFPFNATRL